MTAPSAPAAAPASDDPIRAIVRRLSRPTASGGTVIERAAILAEGTDSGAIIRWILTHDGKPEAAGPPAPTRGLHGTRMGGPAAADRPPSRYLLPAGALT